MPDFQLLIKILFCLCLLFPDNGLLVQLLRSTDLGRHSLLYIKEIGHGWFGKVSEVGLLFVYLLRLFVHLTDMNALGMFCYRSKI